jgi:hypothetical protein
MVPGHGYFSVLVSIYMLRIHQRLFCILLQYLEIIKDEIRTVGVP